MPGSLDLRFVENGQQLLEYLRENGDEKPRPGLVLLDLNMPEKDGRQSLKEIKGSDALSDIPVVVLTTSHAAEDVSLCQQLGADGYHRKPNTFTELKEILLNLYKKWLRHK